MHIEAISAGVPSRHWQRVEAEEGLQALFSQVLAQAGREGFASAELPGGEISAEAGGDAPTAEAGEGASLDEQITAGWNQWLAVEGRVRYRSVENAQQTLSDFNQLLLTAGKAGAHAAPQAYLQQLDETQLATLQQVHHLADPINPDKLTEEGALNLLLPPPAQVDANGDGLTQSGVGYSIRFPDSRTPRAVVDAWNEATEDLSEGERALRVLQMKVDVLLANIHVDSKGRFVSRTEPGEPGFVNPMADPEYSYVRKAEAALEAVEYFKNQTPAEQYDRDKSFWSSLKAALAAHEAP